MNLIPCTIPTFVLEYMDIGDGHIIVHRYRVHAWGKEGRPWLLHDRRLMPADVMFDHLDWRLEEPDDLDDLVHSPGCPGCAADLDHPPTATRKADQ